MENPNGDFFFSFFLFFLGPFPCVLSDDDDDGFSKVIMRTLNVKTTMKSSHRGAANCGVEKHESVGRRLPINERIFRTTLTPRMLHVEMCVRM